MTKLAEFPPKMKFERMAEFELGLPTQAYYTNIHIPASKLEHLLPFKSPKPTVHYVAYFLLSSVEQSISSSSSSSSWSFSIPSSSVSPRWWAWPGGRPFLPLLPAFGRASRPCAWSQPPFPRRRCCLLPRPPPPPPPPSSSEEEEEASESKG